MILIWRDCHLQLQITDHSEAAPAKHQQLQAANSSANSHISALPPDFLSVLKRLGWGQSLLSLLTRTHI